MYNMMTTGLLQSIKAIISIAQSACSNLAVKNPEEYWLKIPVLK